LSSEGRHTFQPMRWEMNLLYYAVYIYATVLLVIVKEAVSCQCRLFSASISNRLYRSLSNDQYQYAKDDSVLLLALSNYKAIFLLELITVDYFLCGSFTLVGVSAPFSLGLCISLRSRCLSFTSRESFRNTAFTSFTFRMV
jgi:hypothetical protein